MTIAGSGSTAPWTGQPYTIGDPPTTWYPKYGETGTSPYLPKRPLDGGEVEVTEYEYDTQGRVTKRTVTRIRPRTIPPYSQPMPFWGGGNYCKSSDLNEGTTVRALTVFAS